MKNIIVIISVYDGCIGHSTLVLEDNEVTFKSENGYYEDDGTTEKPYLKLKKYLGLPCDYEQDNGEVLEYDYLNKFEEIRKIVDRVIYCEDGDIEIFEHIKTTRQDNSRELFKNKGVIKNGHYRKASRRI